MWRYRDGNFPLEWRSHKRRKKNFPINHERHIIYGGAGVVKINFPMSGEAANGEIYFHHDCCAIYYVPWVMNGEIYPSLFLHIKGFTFPYKKGKLLRRCLNIFPFDRKTLINPKEHLGTQGLPDRSLWSYKETYRTKWQDSRDRQLSDSSINWNPKNDSYNTLATVIDYITA